MKRIPPLPKSVMGMLGTIEVRLVSEIPKDEGAPAGHMDWGMWEPNKRLISIVKSETREWQWQTLFHEEVHAALSDAGLTHLLSKEHEEAICDCIASARWREMAG